MSSASSVAGQTAVASSTAAAASLHIRIAGTYWSIATVAKGPVGQPLSAGSQDRLSIEFEPDGTVRVSQDCSSSTVRWGIADQQLTVDQLHLDGRTCPGEPASKTAAAAPLAAALQQMTTSTAVGNLDGLSLVLKAGVYVLVFRPGGRFPDQAPISSADPMAGAAQPWVDFPVAARPRPVVLTASAIIRPADPLPRGEDENAFAAGRIRLPTTASNAPATRGGYPIISAHDAATMLVDPQQRNSEKSSVHIVGVQLVDHEFSTDRGQSLLPAWKLTLAESHDPVFVLAVAAAGRYPATMADNPPVGGPAFLSGGGRELTVSVVAHHVSTGHCDPDYTSTYASEVTPTVVVIAVTLHTSPTAAGCGSEFAVASMGGRPGDPDTRTLHLQQPLGNRVVVSGTGAPYIVIPD